MLYVIKICKVIVKKNYYTIWTPSYVTNHKNLKKMFKVFIGIFSRTLARIIMSKCTKKYSLENENAKCFYDKIHQSSNI